MPGKPFAKGNPGRPKGSKNKATEKTRAALWKAFEKRGGVDELVALEPEVFYPLFGRAFIPRESKVELEGEANIRLIVERSFVGKAKG